MEYHRIDENTIKCIVSPEEMSAYGLDLDELLSRSSRSEAFLKHIVQQAREELGYSTAHGLMSLRIEVMQDGSLSLIMAQSDDQVVPGQIEQHLRQMFPDMDEKVLGYAVEKLSELRRALNETGEELARRKSAAGELERKTAVTAHNGRKAQNETKEWEDSYRVFVFQSLQDLLAYVKAVNLTQPIRSHLFKDQDRYYLVVERYRVSELRFNRLTILAFEYGHAIADPEKLYQSLIEHGELLIGRRAFGELRKIMSS